MLNLLLGIICVVMVIIFARIIYACGYKDGSNNTSFQYRTCYSEVRDMNKRMAKRLAERFARKRTYKR